MAPNARAMGEILVHATVLALAFFAAPCAARSPVYRPPIGPYRAARPEEGGAAPPRLAGGGGATGGEDLLGQCALRWFNQTLDHFSWAEPEAGDGYFQQRYYVCAKHWRPPAAGCGAKAPIFFYVGNEADVLLYLNHTGLMWENAEEFGALLVFAEHRYYGETKPFGRHAIHKHMGYLTTEQALADYADLLRAIKAERGADGAPVVAFGGSYGGMLAAWMRLKYPHVVDGAIAASAPIWNFYGEDPPFDAGSFAEGVTFDASPAGGAAADCVPHARAAWGALEELGKTHEGRATLSDALRLCRRSRLNTTRDVEAVRDWLSSAWDYMAMGDFPYPSSYMLNGNGQLPAYPVRVACDALAAPYADAPQLLSNMAAAVGVFYNFTQTLDCFDFNAGPNPETDADANYWDYQWCTEMFMPSCRDGVRDMFWAQPFDADAAVKHCRKTWGVTPRKLHADTEWGGRRIEAASNIVFSNGALDPWHGGGVPASLSDTLVAVELPEGAHHLDLMFSNDLDPPGVKRARAIELEHMRRWVDEATRREAGRRRARGDACGGDDDDDDDGGGGGGGVRGDGGGRGAVKGWRRWWAAPAARRAGGGAEAGAAATTS